MSTRTHSRIELEGSRGRAGVERSEPEGRAQRDAGGARPAWPLPGEGRRRLAGELLDPAGGGSRGLRGELVEEALERVRLGLAGGELPARARGGATEWVIHE